MSDTALLIQNARRSMAGTHEVLGYVGTDANGVAVLLARDLATRALVGISATVDAANEAHYSARPTLGKTITVPGSMCPECRTRLPELDAFCFHCGANLTGSIAADGTPDAAIVMQALATATEGRYEILGRIDREGHSAAVYFAREVESDSLAALRLTRVDATTAAQPDYVQKLVQIFETGELQEKIAERKAQQAKAERAVAERAATERAAAERAAAERAAAERAAAERAAAERAAAERAAAERAAAERAAAERAAADRRAAERAAAERVNAERVATERMATERMATERLAAERAVAQSAAAAAAYTPTPAADFPPQPESDPAHVSQLFAQTDATVSATASEDRPTKSGSMRTPLIGIGAVAVLAVVGYFAFRGGSKPPTVATTPATADSINAPTAAPTAAQPTTDSVVPPTAPATADVSTTPAPSATAPPTGSAADSGTIRVVNVPADARITIDGRSWRGRLLRVTARAHQLTVTAKGFEPFTEKLTVAPGATVRWSPKLVAIVAANTATNNPPPAVAPSNPNPSTSKKSCRDLMRAEDWSAAHDACATEAGAGNTFAEASLGRMYAKGQGVTRDLAAALTWYKQAAAGGDHDAQSYMGYALRDGNGVKRDDKASAAMFKLAAEGGEKTAQLEYAVALEKGDGVSKNQASAREWYKKAADQGMFMAARRLGRMFEKGDGGPKSEPDALASYEKAATLGDAEAAMTAGKWYRDGRGAAQSPAQALTWFKKALELGNKDAQNEIKKLQK